MEALEEVRRRIVNGRQVQHRRAVAEYNMRVREASRNKTKFPKIRCKPHTFEVHSLGDTADRSIYFYVCIKNFI